MMIVAKIFFWTIGIMFFAGIIGSALVVTLTTIDDIKDLREKHKSDSRMSNVFHHSESEAH